MQLLALAQEFLPPAACAFDSTATTSSSSSSSSSSARCGKDVGGSGHQQQQQQQQQEEAEEAWQLCLAQVQHNLLLVLQVMKHWQYHNAHLCLGSTLHQLR
jgi:hypothetical protein